VRRKEVRPETVWHPRRWTVGGRPGPVRCCLRCRPCCDTCTWPGISGVPPAAAVPAGRRWRLGLPRAVSAGYLRAALASCDRHSADHCLGYAVVLAMARLALRAGEVAGLRLATSAAVFSYWRRRRADLTAGEARARRSPATGRRPGCGLLAWAVSGDTRPDNDMRSGVDTGAVWAGVRMAAVLRALGSW